MKIDLIFWRVALCLLECCFSWIFLQRQTDNLNLFDNPAEPRRTMKLVRRLFGRGQLHNVRILLDTARLTAWHRETHRY